MKILNKILLMIVIPVSLLVGVMSYLSIKETQETLYHEIDHLLSNNLVFAEAKILDASQDIQRTIENIALHPALNKSLFLQVSRGVNRVLNDLVNIYPFYHYILFVEPDGNVCASSTLDNRRKKNSGRTAIRIKLQG